MLQQTDAAGRLARLRPCFSKFDFDDVHPAGIEQRAVDTLFYSSPPSVDTEAT